MLRLIGFGMVGAACAAAGFSAADRLRRRRDFLSAFAASLSVLETEIAFCRRSIARALAACAGDKRLCGLYELCAENVREQGIKNAWRVAAEGAAEAAALSERERLAVAALGSELGMSDTEGQKRAIKSTLEQITPLAAEAAEEYKRLGRAYRGCGVLCGILFVIIGL